MTHTSPTTFAVWSVLSTALGAFLVGHLWRFDKFKCLRWSNAPYSGAFKRIMTYTYLITIPLIMTYSFGFTFIKYKEGFFDIGDTVMPKPYMFWSDEYRAAIFPLMMFFSFAWSFEMVTHLEELCFWYFLITAGPAQPDWFHSAYFRIWVGGSISALVYLPVVTISFRDNPLRCEARMFFSGSIGDLILTLGFIPILYRFPGFIRKVEAEGVDSSIVIRLRKFYELNVIRIVFRFLMQLPLLALGIDGLKPHTHHLNESLFWTDMLSIIAALGCAFSSVCTLLIFFPRSYEAEYHAKEASHRRSGRSMASRQSHEPQPAYSQYGEDDHNGFEPSPFEKSATFDTQKDSGADRYGNDYEKYERTERKMRTWIAKESFGSKVIERERRIAGGTRRMGADLHLALSKRFGKLSLARPRRIDVDGSSGISLSLDTPSVSQEQQSVREGGRMIRRTMPSTRSVTRNRSNSTTFKSEDCIGASLERKGTYLLTDSPVLRARTANQRDGEGGDCAAVASKETLEALYEAGAGREAVYDIGRHLTPSPADTHEIDLTPHYGTSTNPINDRQNMQEDGDDPVLALDSPPSSAVPSYSQATGVACSSPIQTSPTHDQVYGPRPIKNSMSVSATATAVTRRALPIPPVNDPLGATLAYSIADDAPARSTNNRRQSKKRAEVDNAVIDIRAGFKLHPFAASPPSNVRDPAPTAHPTHMNKTNEILSVSMSPYTAQIGNNQVRHIARPIRSGIVTSASLHRGTSVPSDLEMGIVTSSGGPVLGLTAVNLSRLNSITHTSQLNPLVRTFTSPIDFLDRVQGNSGFGSGDDAHGPNASRTQIGRAL